VPSITAEGKEEIPFLTGHAAVAYNNMVFIYGGRTDKKEVTDGLFLVKLVRADRKGTYSGAVETVPASRSLTNLWKRTELDGSPSQRTDMKSQRKLKVQEVKRRISEYQGDLDYARLVFQDSLAVGATAHVYRGASRETGDDHCSR
jgi:hypothetical protein